MYKKIRVIIICTLCVLMVLTSCNRQNKINQTIENNPVNDINAAKSYELVASKTDNQGIELSSAFQLSSIKEIDNSFIKNNLQIIPKTDYKIEKLSNTSYNIIPTANLENNKVYQVKLNSPEGPYSWAFQTKKQFNVESTIPSDNSQGAPVNTGIEMYFSMGNLEAIDKYFSISPQVNGKFIYNKNSVVFVPENELEWGGKYTITIKKGFGVKDSEEKLLEDFVFSFELQASHGGEPYNSERLINIYENNRKIIKGYFDRNLISNEFKIDIYKFNNVDSFSSSLKNFYETRKVKENFENSTTLAKVNTIYQTPYLYENSQDEGLFELPEELEKGYYLLSISLKNDTKYTFHQFLQVNDMMMYNAVFYNEILLYAIDAKNSQGISNAEVLINDKSVGKTKNDGILSTSIDIKEFRKTINIIRLKANGYNDFVYVEDLKRSPYRWGGYYDIDNERYKYLSYTYTDRNTYLPTDKINVWGFARFKNDTRVKKVKLELVEPGTNIVLETKYADLTDIGTYKTEFSLTNYTNSYGKIYVYHNDMLIDDKYFEVKEYTKPIYRIEGKFDKEFVYSGEPLKLSLSASFFDGYPVKGAELRYGDNADIYYAGVSNYKLATLDDNGEITLDIDTNKVSTNWRPQPVTIYSSNNEAEDVNIRNYNSYTVFPKHQMLEVERDKNEADYFSILLHELDNSLYGTDKYQGYESLRGKALNSDTMKVDLMESYYVKRKVSEYYDFINKINVVNYEYDLVTNVIFKQVFSVENGRCRIQIPSYNPERSYSVIVSYDDNNGGIIEEASVGWLEYPYYPYRQNYYTLNDHKKYEPYRINEDINLTLQYGKEDVKNESNDKLVILAMNNGLLEYMISDETVVNKKFKEDYIPNIYLTGAYIKGGYIYPIDYDLRLTYDYTEKQIFFDIVSDKEEYKPGEEVSLDIKAYDENKKPVVADVNISVVDEAYFAVFPQDVNTAKELYQYTYYTGLIKTYLSNSDIRIDSGAEKGGGGDGFEGILREKFKDTNVFETIKTNKDGKASLKFKLADNITSWRITCQAISDNKYAGNAKKNIAVSLPFYIDMIMYKKYLIDDDISVSLRVFGKDTVKDEDVKYKVVIKNKDTNKEEEFNLDSKIGAYANINIGKKPEGTYEVYVYASSDKFKDAIKEEFEVVESFVYFNNSNTYKLTNNTSLDKVYSNAVINLYNDSESDFFNSLRNIVWSSGRRIDQSVCSLMSIKYINEYFGLDWYYDEEELISLLNEYQDYRGGYKLLQYSDVDVEITAKIANSIDNEAVYKNAKILFEKTLANENYDTKIAAALWGLAKDKEPVLLKIYELLNKSYLSIKDKIYLCLALTELGDNNTAEKYYKKIIDNNVKTFGEYLYLESFAESDDNYELTALMSVLGVKLKDFKNSDKFFKYVYKNPSKLNLSNFEQLIYIMNRDILSIDEVKDLFGEITVTVGSDVKNYKLKLFDIAKFSVKKEDVGNIKFSNIKGDIKCVVNALGNKDDLQKNKSDELKIELSYSAENSNSKQNTFKQSDLIKVTIKPSDVNEIGYCEVTYVLPSGFRFVKTDKENRAWLNEDGQKLRFQFSYSVNYPPKPIIFYMQAAQRGEYTADFSVIKDMMSDRLNYVEKSKLIIE